jgi:hypothetical protein
MYRILVGLLGIATTATFLIDGAEAKDGECPRDSVEVGSWRVDKNEASTWGRPRGKPRYGAWHSVDAAL